MAGRPTTCQAPTTLLYEYVLRRDWDSVVKRAHSNPADIRFIDSNTRFTALHVACQRNQVPMEVIHALVDAYNQYFDVMEFDENMISPLHTVLISYRNPLRRVDCSIVKALLRIPNITKAAHLHGLTPIHMACFNEASVEIVRILMEADPASLLYLDADGSTPLLCAIMAFFRHRRQTPNTYDTLKLLLQTCPEAAHQCNFEGESSLQHLFATCPTPNISMSTEDCIIRSSLQSPEFQLFWNNVRLLLCALHRGNIADLDTPNFKCLHAAAAANHAPIELIHFASILHADEAMQTDENGRIPLVVAATSPFLSDGVHRRHVLECLLRANAGAASVADANGRLPFLLAIENEYPISWEMGIQCLLEAAPHAIAIRDRSSRMYPFMIAALQNQDELVGVSNTFHLLREAPHLIGM